ncbi:MAG: hypothetical protein OEX12_01105 [Gammaproteobacteria bacterium]|nr:hypothetical protein [Gammaproteobacteria bacterium]
MDIQDAIQFLKDTDEEAAGLEATFNYIKSTCDDPLKVMKSEEKWLILKNKRETARSSLNAVRLISTTESFSQFMEHMVEQYDT